MPYRWKSDTSHRTSRSVRKSEPDRRWSQSPENFLRRSARRWRYLKHCPNALARHLNLDAAEAKSLVESSRRFVHFGGGQDDSWRSTGFQFSEDRVEQHPPDAAAAMLWSDNDILQDARRPAERHAVVSLDGGVGIANHSHVILGHEDDDFRIVELRAQEGGVIRRSLAIRGKKALRIEIVMPLYEKRAKVTDPTKVGARRTPNAQRGIR